METFNAYLFDNRIGKFNSDDHYIYYCGQESFRRNGVALIVNKRVWNEVLGCNLKNNRMISVRFQGKPSWELMLLNFGVGEDSWESLGLRGDPTTPF